LGTTRPDGSAQYGFFRRFDTNGVPTTTEITIHITRQDITIVIAAIAERKTQEPFTLEQEGRALLFDCGLATHFHANCHEKKYSDRVDHPFRGVHNDDASKQRCTRRKKSWNNTR
jgi:hypothetical protein